MRLGINYFYIPKYDLKIPYLDHINTYSNFCLIVYLRGTFESYTNVFKPKLEPNTNLAYFLSNKPYFAMISQFNPYDHCHLLDIPNQSFAFFQEVAHTSNRHLHAWIKCPCGCQEWPFQD